MLENEADTGVKILPMIDGRANKCGRTIESRWYPLEKFAVPGTFRGRGPTQKWPFNFMRHFYTKKYALILFEHSISLYLEAQGLTAVQYLKKIGVSRDSEQG